MPNPDDELRPISPLPVFEGVQPDKILVVDFDETITVPETEAPRWSRVGQNSVLSLHLPLLSTLLQIRVSSPKTHIQVASFGYMMPHYVDKTWLRGEAVQASKNCFYVKPYVCKAILSHYLSANPAEITQIISAYKSYFEGQPPYEWANLSPEGLRNIIPDNPSYNAPMWHTHCLLVLFFDLCVNAYHAHKLLPPNSDPSRMEKKSYIYQHIGKNLGILKIYFDLAIQYRFMPVARHVRAILLIDDLDLNLDAFRAMVGTATDSFEGDEILWLHGVLTPMAHQPMPNFVACPPQWAPDTRQLMLDYTAAFVFHPDETVCQQSQDRILYYCDMPATRKMSVLEAYCLFTFESRMLTAAGILQTHPYHAFITEAIERFESQLVLVSAPRPPIRFASYDSMDCSDDGPESHPVEVPANTRDNKSFHF